MIRTYICSMKEIAEELHLLGNRYFLTREKGNAAFERIEQKLLAIPDGCALMLCFPPEQVIDASFADSTVAKILEGLGQGKYHNRTILLYGLSSDSVFNIDRTLNMSKSKLAVIIVENNSQWMVVGKVEKSLQETLQLLAKHQHLTAPDLVDILNVAVNTASNRLKRLHDLRLVRREFEISDAGLVYIYYFWDWTSPENPKEVAINGDD